MAGTDAEIGCGLSNLFLYRRTAFAFSSATPKPLSDIAWDYFWSSAGIRKDCTATRRTAIRSVTSLPILLKGMDDNYAWLGQHWPDSRYVVISLSFDAQGEDKPMPYGSRAGAAPMT